VLHFYFLTKTYASHHHLLLIVDIESTHTLNHNMANILDLPTELVVSISSHLSTKDLGTMRRSCKQLEKHLFETFAREFFTKRQFMVEHVSLQALVGIANHPTLSQYLVEVLISTDRFNTHPTHPHHPSREMFFRTGEARDMLAEAFSKLSNLRVVGLRDYDGPNRSRDGSHASWRSYGEYLTCTFVLG
jgi:hypothetical protein